MKMMGGRDAIVVKITCDSIARVPAIKLT